MYFGLCARSFGRRVATSVLTSVKRSRAICVVAAYSKSSTIMSASTALSTSVSYRKFARRGGTDPRRRRVNRLRARRSRGRLVLERSLASRHRYYDPLGGHRGSLAWRPSRRKGGGPPSCL